MIMKSIIDTNVSINSWFRESKLPKFIKLIITKHKRRKLKRKVYKFNSYDELLLANDIFEFLTYSIGIINGKYMYINSIMVIDEDSNRRYSSSMTYNNFENNKCKYHYFLNNVSGTGMDLTIKQEDSNGTSTLCNLKCGDLGLMEFNESNSSYVILCLIGGLNAMIIDMIKNILLNEIERSERIYKL